MRAFNPACEVHIYEPAMTPKMAATIPTWAKLYAEPFDGATVDKPEYTNRSIAILKIDCEGCEFEALAGPALHALRSTVLHLNLEVHFHLGSEGLRDVLKARRMAGLWKGLVEGGMVPYAKEPNIMYAPDCVEYGFVNRGLVLGGGG